MVRWLHLSDIHVGMTDQDWLWPNLKHALYDDLKRVIDKSGLADVIIFSGDMVQKGSAQEYGRFSDVIEEIRGQLSTLGPIPPLVVVPGNHDLERPPAGGLLEAALRQVPGDADVLRKVLDIKGDYLQLLAKVFQSFTQWQDNAISAGVHLKPVARGLLPGDLSFELPLATGSAGIVTLNSSWLQLTGDDYRKRLHVDPRQFMAVTSGDPVAWCSRNDANLVVTHHPTTWLAPKSLDVWESEIFPPSRFDLHLFGHMHEHDARSVVRGGGDARRQLQAASIFGLEMIDGRQVRSHGYSVGEIGSRTDERCITIWPRTLIKMADGTQKLVPDQAQGLTEDNNFSWPLAAKSGATVQMPPVTASLEAPGKLDEAAAARIEKLRYHLSTAKAHLAVRRVEQTEGGAALREDRTLWIACDWGLGEYGYLWSLLAAAGETDLPIYRVDLQDYRSRESFLEGLRATIGCGFEELCEHLSGLSASMLALDNVPYSIGRQAGERPIERDIEDLVQIVREYAPSCRIILRGRPQRGEIRFRLVELRPFEEADVADYVRAHELGGEFYAKPDTVSLMWRHTSGSPVRLDSMLRDLSVTSLSDLMSSASDDFEDVSIAGVPTTLVGALTELSRSDVPVLARAHRLLEALTSLPRGEQLDRMKRFLGPHPFFHNHARELADRGLIETVQLSGLADGDQGGAAKTLVVPRIVLEYVRNRMSPDRRRDVDNRALELYFGDAWRSGEITNSPAGKRCADPLCEPYEIHNACALVHRAVAQNREDDEGINLEAAIRLASAFVEVLIEGDHFGSAAQLTEQVIPLIPIEGNEKRIDVLRYALARSIRMISRNDEARDILQSINPGNLSRMQRRSANLQLALINERLGNAVDAASFAREVMKERRTDGPGIQAQSIIAEQNPDPDASETELATLEAKARKAKAFIAANNIALVRARKSKNKANSIDLLERVIECAEAEGDFYNGALAVIRMIRLRAASDAPVSPEQESRLIRAYQHLYNERGAQLFDRGHEALWQVFRQKRDEPNMLRLFRLSSLIWRLRGKEEKEDPYLPELAVFASSPGPALSGLNLELAYYRARTTAALERAKPANPALPLPAPGSDGGPSDATLRSDAPNQ